MPKSLLVDFTKMRKGTVTRGNRRIDYCPRCGLKGEIRPSTMGGVAILHKALRNPGGLEHLESCWVEVK